MLSSFTAEAMVVRLGWVLVHSLWQFALISLFAAACVRLMRKHSAVTRYALLLAGMVLIVLAPAVTWMVLPAADPQPGFATAIHRETGDADSVAAPFVERAPTAAVGPPPAKAKHLPVAATTQSPGADNRSAGAALGVDDWCLLARNCLQPWLTTIVGVWSLGVLVSSSRPLLSWYTVRRLRRSGTSAVPQAMQSLAKRAAGRLGLRQTVAVLQSTLVHVPVTIGYFRPMILLPVSIVSGLPTSQLEAILAHELAHIRRHDYLVNLLQTLVETVCFYHPAVWWLSNRVRAERENCCDDLTVAALGNGVALGRALLAVNQLRGSATALALGARGGSLLSRVRRLCRGEAAEPGPGVGGILALSTLAAAVIAMGVWAATTAGEPDAGADRDSPAVAGAGKVLHFPPDRSIGRLWVYASDTDMANLDERACIEARGDVEVPAGKRAGLHYVDPRINDGAADQPWDLSLLDELRPTDLDFLVFVFARLPTDELERLRRHTSLRMLGIGVSEMNEDGLVSIGKISSLEVLTFGEIKISDTGMAHLKDLYNLRTLRLASGDITNDGLVHLAKLNKLEELDLTWASVTDTGLRHLAHLKVMQRLQLGRTRIDGPGLVHLAGMSALQQLDLTETRIGDESLTHLKALRSLRSLDLSRTNVTEAGVVALRQQLPETTILSDFPAPTQAPNEEPAQVENPAVSAATDRLGVVDRPKDREVEPKVIGTPPHEARRMFEEFMQHVRTGNMEAANGMIRPDSHLIGTVENLSRIDGLDRLRIGSVWADDRAAMAILSPVYSRSKDPRELDDRLLYAHRGGDRWLIDNIVEGFYLFRQQREQSIRSKFAEFGLRHPAARPVPPRGGADSSLGMPSGKIRNPRGQDARGNSLSDDEPEDRETAHGTRGGADTNVGDAEKEGRVREINDVQILTAKVDRSNRGDGRPKNTFVVTGTSDLQIKKATIRAEHVGYTVFLKTDDFPPRDAETFVVKVKDKIFVPIGYGGASSEVYSTLQLTNVDRESVEILNGGPLAKPSRESLKVKFSPRQPSYPPQGPLNVDILITNVGQMPLSFCWGTVGDGRIRCRDRQLAFTARRDDVAVAGNPDPLPDGFGVRSLTLERNEKLKRSVDLTEWLKFEEPGKHTVEATYTIEIMNHPDSSPASWKVEYRDAFTIEIRRPADGQETDTEIERPQSTVSGWIDSPLIGLRRDLNARSSEGVAWFLRQMEAYTDSGEAPLGAPVADVTYQGAIRLRIYGRTTELHRASNLDDLQARLSEMPHTYRIDIPARSITYYNRVLIEKADSSPMFDTLDVGERLMAKVGNMPCNLILDALTVPFAEAEDGASPKEVRPAVLLPYLGEQYGAGLLARAVAWRLVDRGLGWPSGEAGEAAALQVAETLQRHCLESPRHGQHGWCLRDLRRLTENARSDRIDEVLRTVEAELVKDDANARPVGE